MAQAQVARVNANRGLMSSLMGEAMEYSRKNPAIIPVLQKLGLRPQNESAINSAPARWFMENDASISAADSVGRNHFSRLRLLVHAIAVSLFILAGTVFVFIYREAVLVRRQTGELMRFLAEYDRSAANEFIGQVQRELAEFRRSNPDFDPIYVKYFGTMDPPPAPASKVQDALPVTNQPPRP
jgi:hypothetical protein